MLGAAGVVAPGVEVARHRLGGQGVALKSPVRITVVATAVPPCRESSTSGVRPSAAAPSPFGDWVKIGVLRPQVRRDHPLNLSISISGGKETNQDSLSNGERSGNSSGVESPVVVEGGGRIVAWRGSLWRASTAPEVDLERRVGEGESPVGHASGERRHARLPSRSRVVWDCSPKWVVDSI